MKKQQIERQVCVESNEVKERQRGREKKNGKKLILKKRKREIKENEDETIDRKKFVWRMSRNEKK